MTRDSDAILAIDRLSVSYATPSGPLQALRDVSLTIRRGEIVGLVGESGCGKSTLMQAILRLLPEGASVTGGAIRLAGENLLEFAPRRMRDVLGNRISVVFQDPMDTLNPVLTIGRQMINIQYRRRDSRAAKRDRAIAMLRRVRIPDPEQRIDRYPHEFSGGQRQRIAIARALILNPRLVVCDEPVSALDVSIQAQILNLLKRLQADHGLTYLFISHNLSVVKYMADRVAVMYYGRIVEIADQNELFTKPRHPYTRALLSAVPEPDPARRLNDIPLLGEPPDPSSLPTGCRFRNRCPYSIDMCANKEPDLLSVSPTHSSACWRNDMEET